MARKVELIWMETIRFGAVFEVPDGWDASDLGVLEKTGCPPWETAVVERDPDEDGISDVFDRYLVEVREVNP